VGHDANNNVSYSIYFAINKIQLFLTADPCRETAGYIQESKHSRTGEPLDVHVNIPKYSVFIHSASALHN